MQKIDKYDALMWYSFILSIIVSIDQYRTSGLLWAVIALILGIGGISCPLGVMRITYKVGLVFSKLEP